MHIRYASSLCFKVSGHQGVHTDDVFMLKLIKIFKLNVAPIAHPYMYSCFQSLRSTNKLVPMVTSEIIRYGKNSIAEYMVLSNIADDVKKY